MKKINVLGTTYKITVQNISDNKMMQEHQWCGMCCKSSKIIIIADFDDTDYFDFSTEEEKDYYAKTTIRHEIIHAFLKESGLDENSLPTEKWSLNEEMIDWIAIQLPKILKVLLELKCI